MHFMCSLLPNLKLRFSIHFSWEEMHWNGMTLLFNGMLIVPVSCKPVRRYVLIIRIELSFGCGKKTMVSLKLKFISTIAGWGQD